MRVQNSEDRNRIELPIIETSLIAILQTLQLLQRIPPTLSKKQYIHVYAEKLKLNVHLRMPP
jgi:hypothetical protein